MDGRVNQHQLWVGALQTLHGSGTAVSRTVVYDPEDAASIVVRAVASLPARPAGQRVRSHSGSRNGQRFWHGEHPDRRCKSRLHTGSIRVPPSWHSADGRCEWGASGAGLGCWFFRLPRSRTRRLSKHFLPMCGHTGRGFGQLCRRSGDRVGRSSYGGTRVEWHLDAATAKAYCR